MGAEVQYKNSKFDAVRIKTAALHVQSERYNLYIPCNYDTGIV